MKSLRDAVIETDRLVAGGAADNRETALDRAVRPQTLNDYIGQSAVREQMEIFLSAAKGRGEPLDHTLIFGPPGLGKTTWRASSQMKWACNSRPPVAPY